MLTEKSKIISGGNALIDGVGLAGSRVGLKNYGHLTIIVDIAPSAGTDTAAITLKQCKTVNNSPATEKALSFTYAWKNSDCSLSDTQVKTTYASSITTSAAAKHEQFVLEVEVPMLDVNNDFMFVRADVTDPGANPTPCAITYILSGPRDIHSA